MERARKNAPTRRTEEISEACLSKTCMIYSFWAKISQKLRMIDFGFILSDDVPPAPRKVLFLVSYSHFTHITNITYENGRPWLYIGYQQLQQIIKMRFRSKCHISVF